MLRRGKSYVLAKLSARISQPEEVLPRKESIELAPVPEGIPGALESLYRSALHRVLCTLHDVELTFRKMETWHTEM